MSHSGRLDGKVAIVTGGGMGLGAGIVRKFVHEGARVVLFDINKEAGMKVAASLLEGAVAMFEGDVTNEGHWMEVVKVALTQFGRLDICVNNAGVVHKAAPSPEVPQTDFDRVMLTNVSPLYHSAKALHPHFAKQHSGVFVNISSVSAPRPRPMLVWYAGSKGAVTSITKGLAAEFAKDGIRCNCILPVVADTGMVPFVMGGNDTPEGREAIVKQIPLGRICQPEDVGNAACFLASKESAFITGVELPVDGGRSLM